MNDRIVCWFSCGAASTIAAALTLAENGHDTVTVAYIDTGSEHADNKRFIVDAAAWLDHDIITLRSDKYVDTWDVWTRTRYINGPAGARCTGELKRAVRAKFEQPTDIQVFGFTADPREVKRAVRFHVQNPGVDVRTPLIERSLTKEDCLALIDRSVLPMPAMYALGYSNNNCIGCVKGGMGYWNKIRRDFPDVFDRMALLEREIGATSLKDGDGKLYLDTLDPDRGDYASEEQHDCGLMCSAAEDVIETVVSVRPKASAIQLSLTTAEGTQ